MPDPPRHAASLITHQTRMWKRLLPVQWPYALFLRRVCLGKTLEVGCGAGRVLRMMPTRAVGVDIDHELVEYCQARGLAAFEPEEFRALHAAGSFDTLLVAHVLEHVALVNQSALIQEWLPYVRQGGRCVLVTPQERGYRRDPTHINFVTDTRLRELLESMSGRVTVARSYPFPRFMGRFFVYNEFVGVADGVEVER